VADAIDRGELNREEVEASVVAEYEVKIDVLERAR
jgi:hypothetical protein